MKTSISKLQQWYLRQCDGDWEHSFGIKIDTLDNPGWTLIVDLNGTDWEMDELSRDRVDRSDDDWVQQEVLNSQFIAYGGVENLEEMIALFLGFVGEDEGRGG